MLDERHPVDLALNAFKDPRGQARIRFGLDNIKNALERLGNPQNRLPKTIHIAGTNGKGSVAAFLRAMAEASGLGVHVFTSPHLIRVNERIRLNGRLVDDDELIYALERVEDTGVDLTYFEALTAAAYYLFAEHPADLCIIETGAGGELDSTNVMAKPNACVITSIGRDHEKMFGVSDIPSIARTKAGIMRRDVPVLISRQVEEEAVQALLEAAQEKGARAYLAGRDWSTGLDEQAFAFSCRIADVRAPWLGLVGQHQQDNAAVACAAMLAMKFDEVTHESMGVGLSQAQWPARMQVLGKGAVTDALKARVIIDGAHNPAAAREISKSIASENKALGRKPSMILAMQANKNAKEIVEALAPVVGRFVMTNLPGSHGQEGGMGAGPDMLADLARQQNVGVQTAPDLKAAIELVAGHKAKTVYVCGSLYLAGAVLALNGEGVT